MEQNNTLLAEIWQAVLDSVRTEVSEQLVSLWLAPMTLEAADKEKVTLKCTSAFKANIVREQYIETLRNHFAAVTGSRPEIFIDAPEQDSADIPAVDELIRLGDKQPDADAADTRRRFELPDAGSPRTADNAPAPAVRRERETVDHASEYTFENFIVGNSNRFAHAACIGVANAPGKSYNPLYIYGDSGLGKTHLLYAIQNRVAENHPEYQQVYIKGEEFTNELVESIGRNTTSEFRAKYRRADLLLIDDIQFIAGREATQEEFFHTFNALYEEHKQIIITSDRPPKEIKTLEDRLKTRFEWGLIADVKAPDYELRIAIMQDKARTLGLDIPQSVYSWLSTNLTDNVRQLEGAIKKLAAQSYLTREPITVDMALACVSDMIHGPQQENITPDVIVTAVCAKYGVKRDDIMSRRRDRSVTLPRNVALYIIRRMTNLSLPQMGKYMGRDHSTIMSSLSSVDKAIKSDSTFEKEINDLMAEIKEG